jgi:1,5-anhydro-D-fructose reductase (1,5-anhydro-D-mannitol-forming)
MGDGNALGWGVFGASWIARDFVIPALRASGADVVAVYSTDPERGVAYASRAGIPRAYSSVDAFLADPGVEAVYVSSTNDRHHDQVIAAAAAGKAVLCEKPMATSLEEARAMVAACDQAGVVLAVNHHMRNAPTLRAMRRLLGEGAIGRPICARIMHAVLLPDFLLTWRVGRADAGGGAILDLTVHDADVVRFLFGEEVTDVIASASQQRFGHDGVEDSVLGVMRLASGAEVSFVDTYTIGSTPTSVEVHGTDGSLFGNEVLRQGPVGDVVLRRGDESTLVDVGPRENLYVEGIRRLTEAVRGNGTPVVSGEEGARSLAVALAVAEAARTGRRVTVPDAR